MISTAHQYEITREHAARFAQALAELEQAPIDPAVHPLLRQAEIDGLRSQLDDLREELREYEQAHPGVCEVGGAHPYATTTRNV